MSDEGEGRGGSIEFHAVVDRIEDGDWAVVYAGDEEDMQFDLPVALLPRAAREGGAHLRVRITIDEESRAAAEERTRAQLERLMKKSSAARGKKDFKL